MDRAAISTKKAPTALVLNSQAIVAGTEHRCGDLRTISLPGKGTSSLRGGDPRPHLSRRHCSRRLPRFAAPSGVLDASSRVHQVGALRTRTGELFPTGWIEDQPGRASVSVSPRPCGSTMMNPQRTGDAAWESAPRRRASAWVGLPRRSEPRDLVILKQLNWHV
jgi:hypothetical protein